MYVYGVKRSRAKIKYQQIEEHKVLRLFNKAAQRVPAYRDFLRKHKIDHRKIRTIKDFSFVPLTDRDNYINVYPLESLCLDGDVQNGGLIVSSTGTTGEPLFWPRYGEQTKQTIDAHEKFLVDNFGIDRISTLAVVCFSMGVHIAGMVTAMSVYGVGERGYPICTVTPSIKMDAILRSVKKLSHLFGQVILIGYPPFIKDVLDAGEQEGIDWESMKVRFLFAAEGISEEWRDMMHKKVGAHAGLGTSYNIYGCADAGLLGYETPLSIFVRRLAFSSEQLSYALCGTKKEFMPLIYQYNPKDIFFESIAGELVFSTSSGIPLLRYNIHDRGNIITPNKLQNILRGYDLQSHIIMRNKGYAHTLNDLPFVYVLGRSNDCVTLYGLNIFPEHIKLVVDDPLVHKYCTGKFVMSVDHNDSYNQELNVVLELTDGVVISDEAGQAISEHITRDLRRINVEYNALCEAVKDRAYPHVSFKKFHDPDYFGGDIKHKWKNQK
jgi:phenylacetate-CoA ligase